MSRFTYTGERLRDVRFPLGGIGAGSVSLDGGARFTDWEICNRPNKNTRNNWSHIAVKAERDGELLGARALHGPLLPSFMGVGEHIYSGFGYGPSRYTLGGVPHFDDVTMDAYFPGAKWTFSGNFPANVSLRAFSPFEPQNDFDSSLPAGMMEVVLENTTDQPIRYSVAFTLGNMHEESPVNRLEKSGKYTALVCGKGGDTGAIDWGEVAVATDAERVSCQQNWFRGGWFDGLKMFWEDFARPGELPPRALAPLDKSAEECGTICALVECDPGKTVAVRFVLSWYWPTCENYWNREKVAAEPESLSRTWKNWYATQFDSALAVNRYAFDNWARLQEKAEAFVNAAFGTTVPEEVIDAAVNTLSVLKSPTCLRLEDGSFYGWEGVHARAGSCEGSCQHVWNYQYALPFLFPKLERSMRTLDYKYNTSDNGSMPFRLQLPLGASRSKFRACADGQMGGLIKAYRDWKVSGDTEWLADIWPQIKKSMEFVWSPENPDAWDPEKTGVLQGRQHHTLDMELFGPNSWLTSMYLAALEAAARMAEAMGDAAFSEECRSVAAKGKLWVDQNLWNGEYFIHKLDLSDDSVLDAYDDRSTLTGFTMRDAYWNSERKELKYQIGEGSSIDQMLGQWHAELCGLNDVFAPEKIETALHSLFKYNYVSKIGETMNPCRLYCLQDEAGTLICAYPPKAHRPAISAPYAEETMHGFEYAAASHMLLRGLEQEALTCIRAVRDRYNGERRNPFNEIECGSNYARSMAAWSFFNAYLGFRYDLTRGYVGFHPRKSGKFASIWSVHQGWGEVCLDGEVTLTVRGGTLALQSLSLPKAEGVTAVTLNGRPVGFALNAGAVELKEALTLTEGDVLVVE